jgi:hypothetical protein
MIMARLFIATELAREPTRDPLDDGRGHLLSFQQARHRPPDLLCGDGRDFF